MSNPVLSDRLETLRTRLDLAIDELTHEARGSGVAVRPLLARLDSFTRSSETGAVGLLVTGLAPGSKIELDLEKLRLLRWVLPIVSHDVDVASIEQAVHQIAARYALACGRAS